MGSRGGKAESLEKRGPGKWMEEKLKALGARLAPGARKLVFRLCAGGPRPTWCQ